MTKIIKNDKNNDKDYKNNKDLFNKAKNPKNK